MPRRERQVALLPRRLILMAATAAAVAAVAAAAAATSSTTTAGTPTVGSWPLGIAGSSTTTAATTGEQASPSELFSSPSDPTAVVPASAVRRAWGAIPRSSISSGRRRGPGRHTGAAGGGGSGAGVEFAPLWVRARGGAVGKRASDGKRFTQLGGEDGVEDGGGDVDGEGLQTDRGDGEDEVDDGAVEDDHDDEGTEEQEAEEEEEAGEDTKAGGGSSATTAAGGGTAAAAETAPGEASVLETLDLKTVLPLALKQGAFFLLARWLGKNLRPEVESQVRAARAIYTAYLIFSQGLCMYIRYLIWKKNDDTEIEVPPPAQLKSLIQDAGKASSGAPGGAGSTAGPGAEGGVGGAASSLGPMLDKMMTSKIAVKKYDMKTVQGVRRGQFWASLIMCYTHLKRGMIKPMMLQVSFGLLSLLDSPLFHIYVLGRSAEGNLSRPFKKQGLMASLNGPMEAMAAKAAAAAEAQAAEAARVEADEESENSSSGGGEGGGAGGEDEVVDEDDGGEMPDIEVLTDADEGGGDD